jgi:uncharacterized protein (DUF1697 family)
MTTYVALLRGINIAGHNKVAMSDLLGLLSDLGFLSPRSLLQSGNLVFRTDRRSTPQLERVLEVEAEKRLALGTAFFVRSAREWEAILAHNPFRREAVDDPSHLAVQFLKDAPPSARVRALQAAIAGREVVKAHGREVYVVYPDGFGESRLTTALIDRKLGTRATGRNWNTVVKLAALVRG